MSKDIIYYLSNYLSTLDIVSLSKVCKDFYKGANRRLKELIKYYKKDFYKLCEKGDYLIYYFTYKYKQIDKEKALNLSALSGHLNFCKYFIEKGAECSNKTMINAINSKSYDLCLFFIDKGANYWEKFLLVAAKNSDKRLINLFISKGATNWDWGLYGAIKADNMELIEFFIEKGACRWNWAMYESALCNNKKLVLYFENKGAKDWACGLYGAVNGNSKELVEYFISKEVVGLESAAMIAKEKGFYDLEKYLNSYINNSQYDSNFTNTN